MWAALLLLALLFSATAVDLEVRPGSAHSAGSAESSPGATTTTPTKRELIVIGSGTGSNLALGYEAPLDIERYVTDGEGHAVKLEPEERRLAMSRGGRSGGY